MHRIYKKHLYLAGILFFLLLAGTFLNALFFDVPEEKIFYPLIFRVENGASARETAEKLRKSSVINSPAFFRTVIAVLGQGENIKAGVYEFQKPSSLSRVVYRVLKGDYGFLPIKITIPEGFTAKDILGLLNKEDFFSFSSKKFIETASAYEGQLFPDTYFVSPASSEEEIVKTFADNFSNQVGKIEKNILIMASILEKEVRTLEEKKMVSGILWKRLKANMRLEVDSASETYNRLGLPGAPISNPGLESIEASKNPTESKYFFYLSSRDGATHYAVDFEEHKKNKFKYLR